MFPARGNGLGPALSAFGFSKFAGSRFLRFSYYGEVLDLGLAQLIVLELRIRFVPGLRIKILLQVGVLKYASVASVDLISQQPQVLGEQVADRFIGNDRIGQPLAYLFLFGREQIDVLLLNGVELYQLLVLERLIPVTPVEIIADARCVKFLTMPRIKLLTQQPQFEQTQPFELVLGQQDILKVVHVADRDRRVAALVFLCKQALDVLSLDLCQDRRIICRVLFIPIALIKIFLQPLLGKRLAVNGLDLGHKYRQFRTGIIPQVVVSYELCLPDAHVTGFDDGVALGLGEADQVEVG